MLASFAPAGHERGLRDTLAELGYRVKTLAEHTWFDPGACWGTSPLVLFMARPAYPRERILSVLNAAAPPCLGVCGGMRDPDILSRCSEFAYWPCRPEELALRLERLPRPPATVLPAEGTALVEEFVHLNLIGSSQTFVEALRLIKKLARCDLSTLIQGETGTGKELAARAMHYMSARRDRPFIPVNCGAIPDELIENEFFGHVRGAFTDAKEAQPGVISLAEGGTLFLDEIETLSFKAQVALLRFLQDRQYRVLGGRVMHNANVRVIAAGNVDLAERARSGRFREDLYFRLDVASLRLPPLREREGDARLLAEHFLARYSADYARPPKTLHPGTVRWLQTYSWPGNVRELENFIHRQILLSDDAVIHFRGAAPHDRRLAGSPTARGFQEAKRDVITEFEKTYLVELIAHSHGNVTVAARQARVERRALGKLLKKHGLDPSQYRER